jgi:hypothetical protein
MSEFHTTIPVHIEEGADDFENEINVQRAKMKGAIALNGYDKQSPEHIASLTSMGESEVAANEAVTVEAAIAEGPQDPLASIAEVQVSDKDRAILNIKDVAGREDWSQDRVDAAIADLEARF